MQAGQAFPLVVYAHKLEDNSRKIMDISECVITPSGEREYHTLSYYEKNTKEELETALSIITTSYVRSDDIVAAVRENIKYIKPPLRDVFKSFEGEATAISSNIKRALYKLKSMVDNEIFWEWCDTLIQCQDDRTLKDTLLPIVAKLTDVRIVNSELKYRYGQ